ncbi:MAG: hypothetical protein H6Q88_3586 [Anaeromyxobacteraceae bacterium]|nr:hypothetical protein [Anaeromyxobacteraceae bacterium]
MQLPEQAVRALEAVRRDGHAVRFEIRKACEQERWRLKVCYAAAGGEVQVGLLWSDDQAGLEALKRKLEEECE